MLIVVGVLVIGWISISFYANFAEKDKRDAPPVTKAQYEFRITTTNEILLVQDFDSVASDGYDIYTLNGFYRLDDDKWEYQDVVLSLNEKYWGEIQYRSR